MHLIFRDDEKQGLMWLDYLSALLCVYIYTLRPGSRPNFSSRIYQWFLPTRRTTNIPKTFFEKYPPPSYTSNRYKPFLIIYELKRMISEKLKKGFSPPYFITFIIMAASLNGIVKINEKNGSIDARVAHQRTWCQWWSN